MPQLKFCSSVQVSMSAHSTAGLPARVKNTLLHCLSVCAPATSVVGHCSTIRGLNM
jgi:hypothetical protein